MSVSFFLPNYKRLLKEGNNNYSLTYIPLTPDNDGVYRKRAYFFFRIEPTAKPYLVSVKVSLRSKEDCGRWNLKFGSLFSIDTEVLQNIAGSCSRVSVTVRAMVLKALRKRIDKCIGRQPRDNNLALYRLVYAATFPECNLKDDKDCHHIKPNSNYPDLDDCWLRASDDRIKNLEALDKEQHALVHQYTLDSDGNPVYYPYTHDYREDGNKNHELTRKPKSPERDEPILAPIPNQLHHFRHLLKIKNYSLVIHTISKLKNLIWEAVNLMEHSSWGLTYIDEEVYWQSFLLN